ncbi:MAG: hypothetical protein ACXWQO_00565 [Bdellovibrionota bacterium]
MKINLANRSSSFRILTTLFFLALSANAFAAAGPPLVTDDPGTPGNKNWEINVAFTSETNSVEKRFEAPLLDLNYGLGDHIQLKYEVPWVIVNDKEEPEKKTGFDRSSAGIKWRFRDKEPSGLALSTYPQITFKTPVSESARNADAETSVSFLLPIEAEESAGQWAFNQELGFRWLRENKGQIVYGVAAGRPVSERVVVLGEFHGESNSDFSDHEMLVNIGAELELSEKFELLGSVGKTFRDFSGEPHRYLAYAGLQMHL